MNKKQRKKEFRKSRRKAYGLWKGLTIINSFVALYLASMIVVLSVFDQVATILNADTFWELINPDENAVYYKSDFESEEEMAQYGLDICEQVEAEGATLLMNKNNALPLEKGSDISLFSNSSVNPVFSGTGSGNVNGDLADTFKTAMEKEELNVNETLWDFYLNDMAEYMRITGSWHKKGSDGVSEVPWSEYTDEVKDSFKTYGDAAIVTISRIGGEDDDLEFTRENYLALDDNEKDMLSNIASMKKEGTIKKVILLINSANTLQLDFLKNNEYDIDAVLWIGDIGISGINAVADILVGNVTPSGSLVDTFVYDTYSSPAMANFAPLTYIGFDGENIPENASKYLIYQEGIYIGYKYYETRYEDYVLNQGNAGDYIYNDEVAYPFGYGLSYTDFEYSDMTTIYNEEKDQFEVTVTVTNVGDTYSGKETIQVYSQSPYTDYDKENGVEKPSVALCGFGKTQVLEPGASETITVYVDKCDLASYDAYGKGTYILDDGEYYLTVATDAHEAVNNILAAKGHMASNTDNRMTNDGDKTLVHKWTQEEFDSTTYATSLTGTAIENNLSYADINLYEGTEQKITYLTRNDWIGSFPAGTFELELTDKMIEELQDKQYDSADYENVEMPVLGADNGLKLYDMIGLEYDDPKWNDLLDQLSYNDMVALVGDSFHWTMPIESIQAPGTRDENGPQGLTTAIFSGGISSNESEKVTATAFTSEDVMAATFNTELIYEVGKIIGNNALEAGVSILYGPGNNIHRTPYAGRNYEYYSEDGFISGKMGAAEVKGIQEKGVKVVIKHFAMNDSETDRKGLGIWLNEQAAREIYLEAFQDAFEEADASGVMMTYTRIGTMWAGARKDLVTDILRSEWGCEGLVITDCLFPNTLFINGTDGILAGVSTYDALTPNILIELPKYKDDAVIVTALKEACHRNLYTIANSCGMNGVGENTTVKRVLPDTTVMFIIITIVDVVILIVFIVLWNVKKAKFKKSEAYVSYMEYKKGLKNGTAQTQETVEEMKDDLVAEKAESNEDAEPQMVDVKAEDSAEEQKLI